LNELLAGVPELQPTILTPNLSLDIKGDSLKFYKAGGVLVPYGLD